MIIDTVQVHRYSLRRPPLLIEVRQDGPSRALTEHPQRKPDTTGGALPGSNPMKRGGPPSRRIPTPARPTRRDVRSSPRPSEKRWAGPGRVTLVVEPPVFLARS